MTENHDTAPKQHPGTDALPSQPEQLNKELDQEVQTGEITTEEEEQRMKDVLSGKVGA